MAMLAPGIPHPIGPPPKADPGVELAIRQYPSPNCGPRRNGIKPSLVVLHYTAMASVEAACTRLCDPSAEVSAHYLIGETGDVIQMVDEGARAWHAGAGEWHGMQDINSNSIGIELANRGMHPFSELQINSLEQLLRGVLSRWSIRPEGVIGHSDMAPGRKSDPGRHFDWARLAHQGLAAKGAKAPQSFSVTQEQFRALAVQRGYSAPVPFDALLAATRLRFAPWRTGPLCAADFLLGHAAQL